MPQVTKKTIKTRKASLFLLLVNNNPNQPFYVAWIQSYSLKLVNVNTESKTRGWAERAQQKEFSFLLPKVFSFFSQCIQNLRCTRYTGKCAKLSETLEDSMGLFEILLTKSCLWLKDRVLYFGYMLLQHKS